MRKCLTILLLITLIIPAFGQTEGHIGGRFGIEFQLGTHMRRIGLMYQTYYFKDFVQVSQGIYVHFNFRNLGPKGGHFETRFQLGLMGYWGGNSSLKRFQFNELSLMAPKQNGIGYSYNYYLATNDTKQSTAVIHFTIDRFSAAFENDLFGGFGFEDKFRTGAFGLSYQVDSFQISLQSTLWTGLSLDGPLIHDNYPSKHGYRNLSDVKHGRFSHGILAARIESVWEYNQSWRMEVGWDDEHIRHALQNKFMHETLLSTKFVKYENPHYPMLKDDGLPYLFKEGQKVRKGRLFIQASGNSPSYY